MIDGIVYTLVSLLAFVAALGGIEIALRGTDKLLKRRWRTRRERRVLNQIRGMS